LILHLLTPNARVERVTLQDGREGFVLAFDDLVQQARQGQAVMVPTGVTVKIGPLDAAGLRNVAGAYAAEAETDGAAPAVEVPRLIVPGINRADRRRH
jgi:hypothetical protein